MKKTLIILALIFVSCKASKTIMVTDKGVTLKYDCSHFEPQAKSQADTMAIWEKAASVYERATTEDNYALARSLKAAREIRDLKRLEELVVQDECAHQK